MEYLHQSELEPLEGDEDLLNPNARSLFVCEIELIIV